MKKSSIFMTLGTLVLALTGIVAVKANKKTPATALFYYNGNSTFTAVLSNLATSIITTVGGVGMTKAVMVDGATSKTLYWSNASVLDIAYAPF